MNENSVRNCRMRVLLFLGITCLSVFAEAEEPTSKKDLSNGFRSEIDWVKWSNAIGVAKDLNKPIFFLIHKTWCGACSGLKREFKTSPKMSELIELSKKFVMVNVEDDEEPEDDKYAPDGGYIPRILFLDTDAEPMKTNNEAKYRNNKYFYPLVPQLIDAMQRALIEFEAKSTESSDEPKKDIEKDDSSDDTKSKKASKEEKEETKKSAKKEEEKKSSKKEETKKDSKKDDEKKAAKKEDAKKDSKKDDEKKAAKKEGAKKSTKDKKTKETDKKEKEKSDKKEKKSEKKEKKSDKKDEKKKKDASDKENKENKAKDTKKKSKSDDKKTESKDGKKKDAKAKKQEL